MFLGRTCKLFVAIGRLERAPAELFVSSKVHSNKPRCMTSTSHIYTVSTHRVKFIHDPVAEVLQEEPLYDDACGEADIERATNMTTPASTSGSLSERASLIPTRYLVPAATFSRFYALLAIAACVFALSAAVSFGRMLGQPQRSTNC